MKLLIVLAALSKIALGIFKARPDAKQDTIITYDQMHDASLKSAKILHLVRHGQAYNNLGHYDWLDPTLTDKGVEQVHELGQQWPASNAVDLVVSSPMLRAINTTFNLLDVLSRRDLSLPNFSVRPIIAIPELEELGSSPSSRGHLRKDLEGIIGHAPPFPIDLHLLTPDWNSTIGYWNRSQAASVLRAEQVRQWLYDRQEQRIVVVGHDANLKLLVNSSCFRDHVHVCQGWDNAQVRHFNIEMSVNGEPTLLELK